MEKSDAGRLRFQAKFGDMTLLDTYKAQNQIALASEVPEAASGSGRQADGPGLKVPAAA